MPVTEAQKRATAKYEKENYDKVLVRFPKGTKDRIKEHGESVNGYIISLVLEDLERREGNPGTKSNGTAEAQAIFDKYGKKYVLSGLGQKELAEKYGEETAKKVIEYAEKQ